MAEIYKGLHRIETSFGGVRLALYLVVGKGLTLIDTGCAYMVGPVIWRYLDDIGHQPTDVEWIVNTHAHYDHIGGNAGVQAASGARIAASEVAIQWIEDHSRANREYHLYPNLLQYQSEYLETVLGWMGADTHVDRSLHHGDMIDAGVVSFEVISAPGHSSGDIALFDRDHGTLIVGDAVQGRGLDVEGGSSQAPEYRDLANYQVTLDRLKAKDSSCVLPAHFDPQCGPDAASFLLASREAVLSLGAAVEEALADLPPEPNLLELAQRVAVRTGYDVNLELLTSVDAHVREFGVTVRYTY